MVAGDDPGLDTPLAELPAPEEHAPAPAPRGRRARRAARAGAAGDEAGQGGARAALGAGLGHVRASWRALLLIVLVQLLLGVTVVLPFWQGLSERLDHHPRAAVLAGAAPDAVERAQGWQAGLDPGIWSDLQREQAPLFDSLTLTHFWVVLIAWLFGALAAGGLLGTAVSGENPVRVGAFLTHGAKWYGRMLRTGIVFALAYYLVARIVLEAWGGGAESSEFMAASEGAGWWADRIREAVLVLCFFWFRIAADLARAELVVYGRRSALRAFWRGLWRAPRRRPLALALAVGLPAFVLLLGLGFVAGALTGDDGLVLVALFLVMQVAVWLRWASRAALLGGFVRLT